MRGMVLGMLGALAVSTSALAGPEELIGTKAPGFTLTSDRGTPVSLFEFQGKKAVILAFFPKAFTPG